MADEEEYDPNAGVPLWVNIVVPIALGLLFVVVLVVLFHTEKEVPLETIEDWVEKIPILNKYLSPEYQVDEDEVGSKSNASTKKKTKNKSKDLNESTKIRSSNIRKYDSISSIRTHDKSISSDFQDSVKRPYFYASQGTLVSFESSV